LVIGKNKPNLSQNKPNSKPICRKGKIDAKSVFTKDYEEKRGYGPKKQTQCKPNLETVPGGSMSARVFNPGKSRDNFLDLCVLIWYNVKKLKFINSMEI
jgi:hypothetical protein